MRRAHNELSPLPRLNEASDQPAALALDGHRYLQSARGRRLEEVDRQRSKHQARIDPVARGQRPDENRCQIAAARTGGSQLEWI
jgi:hypothetical protein